MAMHDWNGNGSRNDHFDHYMDMKLSEKNSSGHSIYGLEALIEKLIMALFIVVLLVIFSHPVLLIALIVIFAIIAVMIIIASVLP